MVIRTAKNLLLKSKFLGVAVKSGSHIKYLLLVTVMTSLIVINLMAASPSESQSSDGLESYSKIVHDLDIIEQFYLSSPSTNYQSEHEALKRINSYIEKDIESALQESDQLPLREQKRILFSRAMDVRCQLASRLVTVDDIDPLEALKYCEDAEKAGVEIHNRDGNMIPIFIAVGMPDRAEEALKRDAIPDPLKSLSHFNQNLAEFYLEINQTDRALSILKQTPTQSYDGRQNKLLGLADLRKGKLDNAYKLYRSNILNSEKKIGTARVSKVFKGKTLDGGTITDPDDFYFMESLLHLQGKPEKALEYSERGRAPGMKQVLGIPYSPFDLNQARQVAKSQNATIVLYSVNKEIDNLKVPKIYTYVIQPDGNFHVAITDSKYSPKDYTIDRRWQILLLVSPLTLIAIVLLVATKINKGIIYGLLFANGIAVAFIVFFFSPQLVSVEFRSPLQTEIIMRRFVRTLVAYASSPDKPNLSKHIQKQALCSSQEQCLRIAHQVLIEPIEHLLPTTPDSHVLIISDPKLAGVPFYALLDRQGKHLIDRHTLRFAPSIAVAKHFFDQPKRKPTGSPLIVGNPIEPVWN